MIEATFAAVKDMTTARLRVCCISNNMAGLERIFADTKTMALYPDFVTSKDKPLLNFLPLLQQHGIHIFPLMDVSKNVVIGFLTLNEIDEANKQIEIGYFLGSEFWGMAYAREAVQALLACLKEQGWQRIMATFYSGNDSSEKLLVDMGFKLEGIEKDAYEIHGNKHDNVIYTLQI